MFRPVIANHAKKTALIVALLFIFVSLFGIGLIAVHFQWHDIENGQQIAMDQFAAIREESYQTLVDLNKNFEPVCSDANLRKVRELLFQKRYIGDVGVFDDKGRLICTSITGLLPEPVVVPAPDATARAANGEIIHFNVQVGKLLVAQPEVRAEIVRLGRFNVVINPLAMDGILSSGASSLKHAFPDKLITIWQAGNMPQKWQQQFESNEFVEASMHRFQWDDLTFVMTTRAPGATTVVQTVVPLNLFWKNYGDKLGIAWLLALLIGTLLYHAFKPIFIRWGELKYRINRLLTEENILCMYQPIIDLTTQHPVGCEVLMRLRDGNSIIFPDVAIPAIIDRGLTWKLDQLVVRKSLRELAEKIPELTEFKVAFNFFPNNMVSVNVCRLFDESLQAHPHNGLRFELEVLEQHYQDSMVIEMAKLRAKGFLLAVDDFGTGYSNLGSIKAISPDYLKIDRSFVHDMEDKSLRSSLIPEIVSIGRAVGAQIIAEGIENKRQLDLLKTKGVEFGQGYFFARPQPIDEFAAYIRTKVNEIAIT